MTNTLTINNRYNIYNIFKFTPNSILSELRNCYNVRIDCDIDCARKL